MQPQKLIKYVRLSLTDRCNYRCQYCMPQEGIDKKAHHDILSYEAYLKILRVMVDLGANKVRLTGGEPTVRKGLVSFIQALSDLEGITDLGLTTNGATLKTHAKALYDAGLKRINISLDSLNPQTFKALTRGGDLTDVLEGIQMAKQVGFDPIKINTVVIKGTNDHEMDDFVNLTKEGFEVRFIELMPIGEAAEWSKDRFLKLSHLFDQRHDLVREISADTSVCQYYCHVDHGGLVGVITPLSDHFCSQCHKLRVTSDGMLKTCLHSEEEVDLKPFIDDPVALRHAVVTALDRKSPRHYLIEEGVSRSKRNMVRIGG